MKKIIKLITTFIVLIVVSGCYDITVETGIDNDYVSYLKYDINIDITNISGYEDGIKDYVNEIAKEYKSYGFVLKDKSNDKKIDLELKISQENESYDKAIESLEKILSDPEISFLTSIDFTSSSTKTIQAINFNATTNFKEIFNTTDYKQLPISVIEFIDKSIDEGKLTFVYALPISDVIEANTKNIVNNNMTYLEYDISTKKKSEFKVKATTSLLNDKPIAGNSEILNEKFSNEILIYKILIVVSVLIIGYSIYYIYKQHKNNKNS